MGNADSKYKELEGGTHYEATVKLIPSQKGKLIAITGCTRLVLFGFCDVFCCLPRMGGSVD